MPVKQAMKPAGESLAAALATEEYATVAGKVQHPSAVELAQVALALFASGLQPRSRVFSSRAGGTTAAVYKATT